MEAILILQKRNGQVRSVDIAAELSYSKPSVSVAMKNLRLNGFIQIDQDGHISLLDKGLSIAEKMYERHTLAIRLAHCTRGSSSYRSYGCL